MMFVIRQPDANDSGVHAGRLTIETKSLGLFAFVAPHGAFLELPAKQVEHVNLVETCTPKESQMCVTCRPKSQNARLATPASRSRRTTRRSHSPAVRRADPCRA
ncbi:MAG: hypothetical protein OXF27_10090 [Acidobacteria bacterium]|nr:hypothetical protein [Acidobacteriota bacterium]